MLVDGLAKSSDCPSVLEETSTLLKFNNEGSIGEILSLVPASLPGLSGAEMSSGSSDEDEHGWGETGSPGELLLLVVVITRDFDDDGCNCGDVDDDGAVISKLDWF